ncbi:MAG: ParB/RepB/Spo0J family partition protein [Bacteroidales bacterium]|jgi:ParB-like chromosome segregation protein Spo0J|nr:ParB/RepB/Spo0J family partition protein [Bacteroidales bacterium]
MKISIDILKENPLNQEIYGDDDEKQFNELVEKIRSSGWIKAILINNDYLIISGHRRVRAARILGIEAVDCEFVTSDPDKQVEIFLNENAYRVKSNTQVLREAEMYFEIEKKKAHQRKIAGVTPEVNLPQGRATEIATEKIGMSESSYKKGRQILKRIEQEDDPMIEWILECTTAQSIDAGSKLAIKPTGFIKDVIERTGGDKDKIPVAFREVEQAELK